MTAAIVLNQTQANRILAANKKNAKQIIDSAHSNILPTNRFVFFAAFDGTGNTLKNTNKPNPQTTNVAQLWDQYNNNTSDRFCGGYFPGPGTPGSIKNSAWLNTAVTQEVEATVEKAYKLFEQKALAWFANDPSQERSVSVAITGFSRGVASAAIFSRNLYERGLKDADGKTLIAAQKISVSTGILFEPVTTSVTCSVAFAPVTTNTVNIFALNEYRHLFMSTNYRNVEGIKTIDMLGNHCDVGGGYDNGIDALTLNAATKFFQECGLEAMENVPAIRQFQAPSPQALIHSEGALNGAPDPLRPWSAYRDFEAQPQDFDSTTRLAIPMI
jgi:hypothetical protein